MRVISLRRVREFWERHSDAEEALRVWYKTAEKAEWSSLDDVRKTYSAADCVELGGGRIVTVFNVKRNQYRLVADIVYEWQAVYVKKVLTHPEYSKNKWKGQI